MKTKLVFRIAITLITLAAIASFVMASSEEEANKLYNEAVQLVASAKKAELTSYQEALNNLKQSIGNLEEISSKYPESEVAFKISLGELKVGDYAIAELKELLAKLEIPALLEGKIRKNPKIAAVPILDRALQVSIKHEKCIQGYDNRCRVKRKMALAYAEIGDIEKALQIAKEMPTTWIRGSEFVYETIEAIAEACARAGQFEKALQVRGNYKILMAIVETAIKMGDLEKALQVAQGKGNPQALTRIAEAYIEAGQTQKAEQILDQASQLSQGHDSLITLAKLYIKVGQTHKAEKVLEQALQTAKQIPPKRKYPFQRDTSEKCYALVRIAEAYISIGQAHKAEQILDQINREYLRFKPLINIAEAYTKAGQTQKAEQILEGLTESDERPQIAKTYIKMGKLEKALQVAQEIDKTWEKCDVLIAIAEVYVEIGEPQRAEPILLQTLQLAQDNVGMLKAIAGVYTKTGQKSKAEHILARAFRIAQEKAAKDKENFYLLADVAEAYSEAGQAQKGKQMVSRVLAQEVQAAQEMDSYEKSDALIEIAEVYAKIGQPKMAEQVLEQALQATQLMTTKSTRKSRRSRLIEIAEIYAEIGEFEKALQIPQEILWHKLSKYKALSKITKICISTGQTRKAEPVLEQAFQIAQNIPMTKITDYRSNYRDKLEALLETAQLWVELAPKCEEEIAVKFFHGTLGVKFFESD